MLRWVCFALICCGAVLMAVTTVRFHRFLGYSRQEQYHLPARRRALEILAQCVMVFFVVGLLVGAADVFFREVEPIYLFVALVFVVGTAFIAAMVQMQMTMAESLRQKSTEVMRGFVNSVEMKDAYTQGHSWHVYHVVRVLLDNLPDATRRGVNAPKLLDAALLHDIGKIGVADEILNKRGPLTAGEWEAMKTHPAVGRRMLQDTCFAEIGEWVLYHHERMDGRGYLGLPPQQIPMEARIIALADTYSAMTTDRMYRPKRSHEETLEVMRQVAGTQLDAELVACFCAIPGEELTGLAAFLPETGGGERPA